MDLNRLTEKAQDVIRGAQALAQRRGHAQIDLEHLAVALLSQDGGVATTQASALVTRPTCSWIRTCWSEVHPPPPTSFGMFAA